MDVGSMMSGHSYVFAKKLFGAFIKALMIGRQQTNDPLNRIEHTTDCHVTSARNPNHVQTHNTTSFWVCAKLVASNTKIPRLET
jgi:hypothetical protein